MKSPLIAFTLSILLAFMTAASAASPVGDYLAARDRVLKQFKDRDIMSDDAAYAAHERARRDLEARLRKVIGSPTIEGFPESKINLESLAEGLEGYGLLDGLVYSSPDQKGRVVVTTDELLGKWLAAHKRWWGGKDDIPPGVEAALKSESFYTQALNTDAHIFKFVDVPLDKPANATFAYAALVGRAQDYGLLTPKEILVLLRRGGRLFVVSAPAAVAVGGAPACAQAWERDQKQALAADGDRSEELQDEAYRAYRRCFAAQATAESYFPALAQQAQALIDMLPTK
jgi:hypothetical protein